MNITMNETKRGTEDGFSLKTFEKGVTYDVADTLARAFLREGRARVVTAEEIERIDSEARNG